MMASNARTAHLGYGAFLCAVLFPRGGGGGAAAGLHIRGMPSSICFMCHACDVGKTKNAVRVLFRGSDNIIIICNATGRVVKNQNNTQSNILRSDQNIKQFTSEPGLGFRVRVKG